MNIYPISVHRKDPLTTIMSSLVRDSVGSLYSVYFSKTLSISVLAYWKSLLVLLNIIRAISQSQRTDSSYAFFIRPNFLFVKVTCRKTALITRITRRIDLLRHRSSINIVFSTSSHSLISIACLSVAISCFKKKSNVLDKKLIHPRERIGKKSAKNTAQIWLWEDKSPDKKPFLKTQL